MKLFRKTATLCLLTLLACGLSAQVLIHRNFDLELVEKDSAESARLEASINGFLSEAQERNYSTQYVDSTHLQEYEFFFYKLGGIGKDKEVFDQPLVLKSYPVEDGSYRVTVGFTGEVEGNPMIFQMTELKAVPFENGYRFYCPFEDNTQHFKTKVFDHVTYHYSTSIDDRKAREFVGFTQKLAALTNGPLPQLNYYSFRSLDELLKSYGFLYSARQCNFLCYDLGFTDNGGNTYLTGTDNENYAFGYVGEYCYQYLPNREDVYQPFVQGMAAYYGGYGLSYDDMEEMKQQFRTELASNPGIDFLEEFRKGRKSSVNRHFSFYVMSAFLFEKALSKHDGEDILALIYSGGEGEMFFENLDRVLGINEKNFHQSILKLIGEA